MPISTPHPKYAEMLPQWKRCRAAVGGRDSIHKAGTAILPKIDGQDDATYKRYQERADYYNASGRTVEGYTGMLMRKEPVIELPAAMEYLVEDVDGGGTHIDTFLEALAQELIVVSRAGILSDMPIKPDVELTVAQTEQLGLVPRLHLYTAESILNWRTGRDASGKHVLTMVVLQELATLPNPDDPWADKVETQYRVLDLDGGIYRVRVFAERDKVEQQIGPDVYPQKNGVPMDFIPFNIIGPKGRSIDPVKPIILDLVDTNLGHYRKSADYGHGLHFTALPTAVITGHQAQADDDFQGPNGQKAQDEQWVIGSANAWVFPSKDTQVSFLEFQGTGLGALKSALDDLKGEMATLGARVLAPEKRAAEAAETAAIHRSGESSVLGGIALSLDREVRWNLNITCEWSNQPASASVRMNKQFMDWTLSSQEITALVGALQAGTISSETFYFNMVRGQVMDSGTTYDEEQERIAKDQADALARVPAGTIPIAPSGAPGDGE